jgi:hypothetical protein
MAEKAADGAEETAPRDGERTGATPAQPAEADSTSGSTAAPKIESKTAPKTAPKTESKPKASSRTSREPEDKDAKKGSGGTGSVDQVRSTVATVVWVAAVLCALVLAAGALVVALDFNARNGVVKFLTDTANNINFLGDLKTFEPDGRGREAIQSARTKEVLVNWGICAVVYLVGGKILDRVIRP